MNEVVLGPEIAGLRRYSTGLWSIDHGERPKPPYIGQGWAIGLRFYQHVGAGLAEHLDELHTRLGAAPTMEIMEMTERGVPRWRTAPELLVFARNRQGAQRAANLLFAAILVFDGQSLFLEEIIAVPEDEDERGKYPPYEFYREVNNAASETLTTAAALAARLSRCRKWQHAAMKLVASHRLCSIPLRNTDPHRGRWYGVEKDPAKYVVFAHAIIGAYSAIEELGFEVRATSHMPSKIDGKWNPRVRAELEGRLTAAGVDIDQGQLWLLRNPPNRIERKRALPAGDRLSWSRGPIRDRKISLVDAIAQASWLRSRVSSHRFSNLAPGLTVMDVVNVQLLARRLLLERTGFLPGNPLRSVVQEPVARWVD
jgi:hypothetical protein